MAGHRNFNDLRTKLADQVGEDTVAGAERGELERYDAETARLADVRRARALTQAQLAKVLGVSQAQVSRIESQSDLYLSTLASYIEAMGGELELVGVFGGQRVHLAIGDVQPADGEEKPTVPDLMSALEESLASVRESAGESEARDPGPGVVTILPIIKHLIPSLETLTERESYVLRELADGGVSTKDLAERMDVTESAVKRSVRTGFGKIGVALTTWQHEGVALFDAE